MRKQPTRLLHTAGLLLIILSLLPLASVTAGGTREIDRDVLLHDSTDTLYRTPGGAVPVMSTVTLRFSTLAGDVDSVTVRVWDALAEQQHMLPMAVVTTTPGGFDLWETTLDVGDTPTIYWYRFIVTKGGDTLFYEDDIRPGADGAYFPANESGRGRAYESSPDLSWQITVYDPDFYTPEWMRNAVVYQIFPDRFRNGDPSNDPADDSITFYESDSVIFHETWNEPPVDPRQPGPYQDRWNVDFFGGDLAGITEQLDYLQDLGVTAIYLNPIFEARSNHRYDTADYKAIDPILGDMETFRTLVAEADKRGMVLILDGVFNHMSSDSPAFDRYHRYDEDGACESLESPYRLWFFFVPPQGQQPSPCVDNPQGATYYVSWAGYDSIPKIDNEANGPRLTFFLGRNSVVNTWGREGIGGWRLDVGGDIDSGPGSDFWEGFRVAVRNANPEGVIIGEEWGNASKWLLGDEWDSVMNYRLRRGILGYVREFDYTDNDANGDNVIHALTPSQLDTLIRDIESDYPPMAYHAMMNILDSHDTARLRFVAGDSQRQQLAALLQFTLPGAPTIYYGDEIALDAPSVDDNGVLQDDPYNRAPYPWPDASGDASGAAYGPPDEAMLSFYQQLAALRHANSALREGDMITLVTDDDFGVYAFLRVDAAAGSAALVVTNKYSFEQTVTLNLAGHLPNGFPGHLPDGLTLDGVFRDESITVGSEPVDITISANSGDVWSAVTGTPFPAATPPANLTAIGADGSVTLGWDAAADVDSYIVYRSPVATGGFTPASDVLTDPAFIDENVINGYAYYYAVASVIDGLPGDLSASVAAIPSAPVATTVYVPTSAPDHVTLAYGLTTQIEAGVQVTGATESPARGVRAEAALVPEDGDIADADWQPMQYVASEEMTDYYAATLPVTASGTFMQIARFSANAGESWIIVTLPDGTFPVLAVDAPADADPPGEPASAEIVQTSLAGVILAWEASPADDVAAYRIYRTVDDVTAPLVDIPAGEELTHTDKTVVQGGVYGYAITAVDGALNESAPVPAGETRVERRRIPVTFVVTVPDYTSQGEGGLVIAGDFGTDSLPFWDPAGIPMEQIDDQHWTVTLEIPEGNKLQYKYARGTWDAVEKGPECEEIANRTLTVEVPPGEDSLLVDGDLVAKWRDLDKCP